MRKGWPISIRQNCSRKITLSIYTYTYKLELLNSLNIVLKMGDHRKACPDHQTSFCSLNPRGEAVAVEGSCPSLCSPSTYCREVIPFSHSCRVK